MAAAPQVIVRMLETLEQQNFLLGSALQPMVNNSGGVPATLLPLSVLDVGAGSGLTGLALAILGADVTLTDYEPRVVEQLIANIALSRLTIPHICAQAEVLGAIE